MSPKQRRNPKPHPYKQPKREKDAATVEPGQAREIKPEHGKVIVLEIPVGAVKEKTDLEVIIHESDFLILEITANKKHEKFKFEDDKPAILRLKGPAGGLQGAKLYHFGPTGCDKIDVSPDSDKPGWYTAPVKSCSIFILAAP